MMKPGEHGAELPISKICLNCGDAISVAENRCPTCGAAQIASMCNACGDPVPQNASICKECGSYQGREAWKNGFKFWAGVVGLLTFVGTASGYLGTQAIQAYRSLFDSATVTKVISIDLYRKSYMQVTGFGELFLDRLEFRCPSADGKREIANDSIILGIKSREGIVEIPKLRPIFDERNEELRTFIDLSEDLYKKFADGFLLFDWLTNKAANKTVIERSGGRSQIDRPLLIVHLSTEARVLNFERNLSQLTVPRKPTTIKCSGVVHYFDPNGVAQKTEPFAMLGFLGAVITKNPKTTP